MKRILGVLTLVILGFACAQALAQGNSAQGAQIFADKCARCHGDDGGNAPNSTTPLREQTAAAIIEKLNGYKAGTYGGSRKSTMEELTEGLPEAEISAVAGYIGR